MIQLKKNYVTHRTGEGAVLLAVGKEANEFHKVIKLNATAAEIVNLLSSPTEEDTIISVLAGTYPDEDRALITQDVKDVLETLRNLNVLDEN